jgi:hypothetical protein
MSKQKDARTIIINRVQPSEAEKDALAEALAKAITGGDYEGYIYGRTTSV